MGIITLIPLLLFSIFFIGCEPPSLSSLERKFSDRKPVLVQIQKLSDAEPRFTRVDPTFINYEPANGEPGGQKFYGKNHSPLKADEWEIYRKLFSEAGLHQGFNRDDAGNMFFMADSVGILDAGHTTGYLFCVDPGAPESKGSRFEPCMIRNADHGSNSESDPEAYTYKKVAEHWYVFDQGPS